MPLEYDDVPGSWGTQSEGWPSTPYTIGKLLLCTKAEVVPYGSYVVVGVGRKPNPKPHYPPGQMINDYSNAVIRCATREQIERLEAAYQGMFIDCRHLLLEEEFANG